MDDPGPYYRPFGVPPRPPPRRFHWLPVIIGVVLAAVAALLLLLLLFPAAFGVSSPSGPYRYYPFGGFFLAFFILIIVFFIVRVAFWSTRASRYGQRYGRGGSREYYGVNRPAMIARMRYARGEITREQYDQIMKDLGRPPGPS
jgi:putative membrane protein